jgi:hypothetical protein
MSIEKHLINLINPHGFDKAFSQEVAKHGSNEAAFQKLNSDYEREFGQKRYSSYESYKVARSVRQSKNS